MATSTNHAIRALIKSMYDAQDLRVQMGNRITMNFKKKLGMDLTVPEKEAAAQDKKMLEMIRADYKRITDGIVYNTDSIGEFIYGNIPRFRQFKPVGIITDYVELLLINQYMRFVASEDGLESDLKSVLKGIPIYDQFLSKVLGCGPMMSGVIISEIDIFKAEYPSNLHAYAGLDVVEVEKVDEETNELVRIGIGRNRQPDCLVEREYINANNELSTRMSINFNPFLKTKLVGVLGSSFLKATIWQDLLRLQAQAAKHA